MVLSVVDKMQDRGTRSQSRGGNGERVAILNRVVIEGLSLKAICEQKPDEDEGIGHAHVEEELG